MLESEYQAGLIKRLKSRFRGCVVLKNDSSYIQGIPDLTIFYEDMWAVLEVKPDEDAPYRPNQEYYLELLGAMSFSATIYPSNEEAVLSELQLAFRSRRDARVPQSEQVVVGELRRRASDRDVPRKNGRGSRNKAPQAGSRSHP